MKVRELRFCTCWPEVPRTAESEETRQTVSLATVLGSQPLEQGVGVLGVADLERAECRVLPHAVEDEHAARAVSGDEARQPVDELARVLERPRVQQVVAVEEVERRLSHRAAASPRRAAAPLRR